MSEEERLKNVCLSLDSCPLCLEAGEQDPMTFEEWASSVWGLPGSGGRYCLDHCHCVLLPEAVIEQFPAINDKVKLRGEEGSDICPVVEIGPAEVGLKDIKEAWSRDFGRLPREIYAMKLEEIEPYLRKLYAQFKAPAPAR